MTKTCNRCCEDLPLDRFNRNRRAADGLQPRCRECSRELNRRWAEGRGRGYRRRPREPRPEPRPAPEPRRPPQRTTNPKLMGPKVCRECGALRKRVDLALDVRRDASGRWLSQSYRCEPECPPAFDVEQPCRPLTRMFLADA